MNPLSSDLNVMRQTLLFGGLESIEHNVNRKNGQIRFFEFGNCYDFNADNKKEDQTLAQFSEEYRLALWVSGNRVENNWNHPDEKSSVYELKAYVLNILERIGVNMSKLVMGQLSDDIYSNGVKIMTGAGRVLGTFGIVSKKICKALGVNQEVYYAELSWTTLMKEIKKAKVSYTEISKFPAVKRDLALLIDKAVTFAEIEKIANESERKLLKDVVLFDVYEGKNLPAGKKSYAVSFYLQDESKTLNDKQIDAIMKKIQNNLEQKLGAQLR
jgi:phenylalanyl-tRNA synthetase beta chain